MTQFQIIAEQGLVRFLKPRIKNLPPTPWLIRVENGILKIGDYTIEPIFVDGQTSYERGTKKTIPIFSPLLSPDVEFVESNEFEYDLFLDRIEVNKPEGIFGITFDPTKQTIDQLKDGLRLGPSIISLRLPPLSKSSPKDMTQQIYNMRSIIPPDVAIYLPRTGYLGINTYLIAMGIDIIDNAEAYLAALERISFKDAFISVEYEDLSKITACNINEVDREFEGIKKSLKENTIWQRVFREMHVSPTVASYVKHAMRKKFDYSKWGFSQSNKIMFIGDESLQHPEVIAFQSRLQKRYQIPPHKKVLVLLPCSARKPYSFSKSHRLFEKSIRRGLNGMGRIAEVWSLTSPMGVVPRELETIYPARTYDIPVSGDWSAEEINQTVNLLKNMLTNVPQNVQIVAHVSEGYKPIIEELKEFRNLIVSWDGARPSSHNALKNLENALRNLVQEEKQRFRNKANVQHWIDTIVAQTKWNHGVEFTLNTEGWKFKGRPPRPVAIQKDNLHYLTWDMEKGSVRLFPSAIFDSNLSTLSWVIFDGESLQGSSLFIPGIKEASKEISPGDEVIIYNEENRPIGIGDAVVSGSTMNTATSGAGVRIRKRMG